MALISFKYMSKVLRMQTDIAVVLPDYEDLDHPPRFKTLYLLHGFSGDCQDWLRNTSIERQAIARNLAVVMPCGYNSAYTDMAYGQNYFTYLSEELPRFVGGVLPLSTQREDCFVAGNSMGGYGALKWALSCPECFAAAASFSGSLHVEDRILGRSANSGNQCKGMYGDPPKVDPPTQDLFAMLESLKRAKVSIPRLFACCGTGDKSHIYGAYADFSEHAKRLQVPVYAEDGPGGHTWEYWESRLSFALDWLLST